ncbi:MAG: hypothetical protein IPJ65_02185 [Archangiaceae bacterium]|nr:hypothetical protein [Archangiaceae bacterium]
MTPVLAAPPAVDVPNRVSLIAMCISLLIIPVNCGIYFLALSAKRGDGGTWLALFSLLALGQRVTGTVAMVAGHSPPRVKYGRSGVATAIFGALAALGALAGWVSGFFLLALGSMGGAWGRPLRVRGRQLPRAERGQRLDAR